MTICDHCRLLSCSSSANDPKVNCYILPPDLNPPCLRGKHANKMVPIKHQKRRKQLVELHKFPKVQFSPKTPFGLSPGASSKVAAYCQKSGSSTCPLLTPWGAAGCSALGDARPRQRRWRRWWRWRRSDSAMARVRSTVQVARLTWEVAGDGWWLVMAGFLPTQMWNIPRR